MSAEPRYIPAARWRVFSRVYDPVLALTMREGRFRGAMLERAEASLPRGGSVLDVGCGTGTFAIALAASRPDAEAIGIDGDPEILSIAKAKSGAAAVDWRQGGVFWVSQAIDGFDRTADHRAGRLPEFLDQAGFEQVERFDRLRTVAGSLDLLAAG